MFPVYPFFFGLSITIIEIITVFIISNYSVMRAGRFPLGDFSIFICYLDTLNDCILRIIELYTETKKAEVSYQRIRESAGEENTGGLGQTGNLILAGSSKSILSPKETDNLPAVRSSGSCWPACCSSIPACICWMMPQAPWTEKQNERSWKPSGNGSGGRMGPQSSSATVTM